ncbi:MAG TPA: sulfite exporter TauE/SafE family protein [Dehalococcoidales bacterium]|nr:sulfite exporter TauE/SafE family protein [Dehalococcoidales bacterium]
MIPGIDINLFFLVPLGLAVGTLSGFVGVGGGFVITPTLITLGFPANYAVGTSLAWVMGNSIIGTLRHRQLGNVDMKLGALMMIFMMGGVEIGVRLLNWTKGLGLVDAAVLSVLICILFIVGLSMFREAINTKAKLDTVIDSQVISSEEISSADVGAFLLARRIKGINIPPMMHFAQSGVTISLWFLLIIGLFTGILSGFIGVGGGFIMVPSLIYLIGVPSFMAVGTDLFQIVFSAAFGSIRHTLSGNVIIFAAFIMLLGSSIGTQFGALVTRYLRGIAMRYILASTIVVAFLGSILELVGILSGGVVPWLQTAVIVVIFGGLGIITATIIGLFIAANLYRNGLRIPRWIESLLAYD